ncbi:MAG TPA: glycosyltransferase family 4 protein, partial [Candidatus Dormibacteraeota bacterium]|nr:glycosyltransferase family 4 protein [Candidatus Dormibacteraeota bacterium]
MSKPPLTVLWIPDFPIEWIADLPDGLRDSPRRHPATWQLVLLSEFEKNRALKIHVMVMRHRIDRSFSFERNGVTYHVLKARPWTRLGSIFLLDAWLIRRLCRRIQPDLVHAWGSEKGGPLIARYVGYPYLTTVQGLYGWYKERVPMATYDHFIERLERIYLPRSPVVTTESNFAVRYLKDRYPQMRIQQAEHAPNQAFFQIKRQPQTNPLHFITVGGLGQRKGTDILFKSLDRLATEREFKLTVLTNPFPGYIDSLRAGVSEKFWNRIEFKYQLLPNQVAGELVSPTMLLLPTRADTSPNAVKEAVVAGVPVVSSNVGGIPDYVFPGKNGLLGS